MAAGAEAERGCRQPRCKSRISTASRGFPARRPSAVLRGPQVGRAGAGGRAHKRDTPPAPCPHPWLLRLVGPRCRPFPHKGLVAPASPDLLWPPVCPPPPSISVQARPLSHSVRVQASGTGLPSSCVNLSYLTSRGLSLTHKAGIILASS